MFLKKDIENTTTTAYLRYLFMRDIFFLTDENIQDIAEKNKNILIQTTTDKQSTQPLPTNTLKTVKHIIGIQHDLNNQIIYRGIDALSDIALSFGKNKESQYLSNQYAFIFWSELYDSFYKYETHLLSDHFIDNHLRKTLDSLFSSKSFYRYAGHLINTDKARTPCEHTNIIKMQNAYQSGKNRTIISPKTDIFERVQQDILQKELSTSNEPLEDIFNNLLFNTRITEWSIRIEHKSDSSVPINFYHVRNLIQIQKERFINVYGLTYYASLKI